MTATHSFPRPRPRAVLLAAAAAAALGSIAMQPALAQNNDVSLIKKAQIATQPLYSAMAGDRPTMLLAPSIEFPTVGAQYRSTDDYSPNDEYIGYYNAEKCYVYDYDPDDDDDDDDDEDDDDIKDQGYFKISGNATGRRCSGNTFSGNFLNWASSSSMDIMRLALTGGDRILDTTSETILQRAYLPNGTVNVTSVKLNDGTTKNGVNRGPGCFFNNAGQFPGKKLTMAQAAGAVPALMIEQAQKQSRMSTAATIYVGNMGNRIYFGLVQGAAQNCTSAPQTYTLGTGRDAPATGGYDRTLSGLIPAGTAGAPTAAPSSVNDTGATPITHTSGDNTFTYYCPEGRGGCYPGGGKDYIVWYGSPSDGWATVVVGKDDAYGGAFRCTTTDAGGGGYKLELPSGKSGDTYPTPSREGRGCWMMEPKTPAKGDTKYALNSKGYFLARVKVCDQNDVRDYGMCTEYPSGKKKPTGVIQKYADNLRLAAFGYAIDPTAAHGTDSYKGRFGALLRAPMKYVGPNTYSTTGVKDEALNPKREWNPETGVLIENPDGVSGSNFSGVINYFNRFGRNPDKPGNYKQYDNVAEMYYEALRYMQGLSPSPNATLDITDDMKDGMPAYTSWTGLDPFGSELGYSPTADYTCLKSSILVVGDINTHDAVNGNVDVLRDTMANKDETKNEIDIAKWRSVVRGFETKGSVSYKDGSGDTRTTSRPNSDPSFPSDVPGGELGRNLWSFLPGMAYWAHTHDIRGKNWTNVGTGETAYTETDEDGNRTTFNSKVRPGLRIKSYFFDVNESQMSTRYTARVGSTNTGGGGKNDKGNYTGYWGNQYWLAAKYGGFKTQPLNDKDKDFNTQGNPFYQTSCTKDEDTGDTTCTQLTTTSNSIWADLTKGQGDNDTKDAYGNYKPEPRTYYMPSNARGVLRAFEDIFGDQEPPGNRSIAGADSSGGIGSTSFQAEFDGSTWSGDVIAEEIAVGGGVEKLRASSALPSHDARKIFMASHGDEGSTSAFAFTAANASLLPELDGSIKGIDASAADRINWLRGDRSKEGSPLRERKGTLLGDIVNSGVKYVGAPAGQVNLGEGYDDFVSDDATKGGVGMRTAALYVGANDGMLHAFHAGGKQKNGDEVTDRDATLEELFAFIPSWMKDKLAALTDPAYEHQAYVDATPVVGDAVIKASPAGNASDWASVLVGGTGGGGRGVYALDVTNPAAFDESKVLWEFTGADDPDMGYVLGQARIVKLLYTEASAASGTPAVYRWFAMVPAGVNNYVGDATVGTTGNGDANIFLLALDKARTARWQQGANYWKLRLPRIEALQADYPTGVLNLEAFTGLGGVTEYVYAGDLHGQLWAFSFKDTGSGSWNELALSNNYNDGANIKPLFIAKTPVKDGKTEPQPITVAPTILEGAGNGVHFVSFGTGKYFEPGDANTTKIDTFYTVYSNFNTEADKLPDRTGEAIIPGRSYLQEVKWDKREGDVDYFKPDQAFYWDWLSSAPSDTDANRTRSGWYLDFVERGEDGTAATAVGERQIADASWISLTSRLMFSTLTPKSATNTDVCGTGGGDSKLYTFDMISGVGTRRASGVGMLAQPLVFLDTTNTTETAADSTGRRLRISPVMSGQFGSDGSNVEQVDTVIVPFGRLSWRRIDNFEGLRQEGGTSNPSAGGGGSDH